MVLLILISKRLFTKNFDFQQVSLSAGEIPVLALFQYHRERSENPCFPPSRPNLESTIFIRCICNVRSMWRKAVCSIYDISSDTLILFAFTRSSPAVWRCNYGTIVSDSRIKLTMHHKVLRQKLPFEDINFVPRNLTSSIPSTDSFTVNL